MKNYLTRSLAAVTIASMAYAPYANAGPVKNFFKGVLIETPLNAIITVGKTIESTVKEVDPVKGARRGVFDTVEALGYGLACKESGRQPDEIGKANTYIEDRPVLEAVVDMGITYGGVAGIARGTGSSVVHAHQAGGYAAGGEGLIKAIKGIFK